MFSIAVNGIRLATVILLTAVGFVEGADAIAKPLVKNPERDHARIVESGRDSTKKSAQAAKHPALIRRLEGRLIHAWEQAATEGVHRAAKSLADSGLPVQGSNVVVIVQCEPAAVPPPAWRP